ncbi:MAG: Dabb family protein [Bacteroidota bacterium]
MQNELTELKEKLAAAEKALATPAKDETAFIHTVFFWMKEGITDEQKADFVKNGLGEMKKCPQLYKVFSGPPAGTPREVVDNSYDYAWICHFKSKADQDAYQTEPIHVKFVEDYKDLWERVQVYDNLVK